MRKELADNLVIIGGTSQLPGFRHRLKCELKSLLSRDRYKSLAAISSFKFHNPPAKENYVAWLGGKGVYLVFVKFILSHIFGNYLHVYYYKSLYIGESLYLLEAKGKSIGNLFLCRDLDFFLLYK